MRLKNMSILFIGLVLASLILAGCTGSKTEKSPTYTCWDGSQVADYHDCPSKQSGTTQVADTVEEDEEVSDLCVDLLKPELDTYVITDESWDCYANKYLSPAAEGMIGYTECDNIILGTMRASCYGMYAGYLGDGTKCSRFTDSHEKDLCLTWNALSLSYNGKGEISPHLCDGIVEESVKESCLESITPYLPCQNSDGLCPDACNYLTDDDCPAHSLGQTATASNGLAITISGPGEVRHCYTPYSSEISDYGHYYVMSMSITNTGNGAEYISQFDFILVDGEGIQHEFDSHVSGETCEDASEFEPAPGTLYPGSTSKGELWFELGDETVLPSGEQKIIYDPNSYVQGDDLIFVFDG